MLKLLRNGLLVAGLLCIAVGVQTALDLRQQAELVLPTPAAIGDPAAPPHFGEEAVSAATYSNCLSCHWDKTAIGRAAAAAPDDVSLQAQVARLIQGTESETSDVPPVPGPLPTLPPLPRRPTEAAERPMQQPRVTVAANPSPGSAPSAVPKRIVIPSVDVDSAVVTVAAKEQDGHAVWEVPTDVVGWYQATAPIGGSGNTVMSGHVAQREGLAVFRDLYQVKIGDPVYLDSGAEQMSYLVRDLRIVLPGETHYLRPTPDATLTLITCAGHFDAETRSFSHRLIVIAKPVERGTSGENKQN